MEQRTPITQLAVREGVLDLGWGHPAPWALPCEEWAAATAAALREFGAQALAYGAPAGPGPLIEWLAAHLATTDARAPDAGEVFVTAGASHALDLVCTLLLRPGDVALVDSPTYHLALRVIADRGARIVAAPADADGLDPAGTADLVQRLHRAGHRVALLYLVPTFANPTGGNLPAERRAVLVELAARTGVALVEDDTYREMVYEGSAPPSLWSAGGAGAVRIGSFAKTVAPGLRLGWVNAAPELVRDLAQLGYVHSGGGVNHTAALAMAAFGSSGAYERHLRGIRPRYAAQRDALVAGLNATGLGPVAAPRGGWFCWLRLPAGTDATALLPRAERHGVSYLDGRRFFAGPGGGEGHARLSFSLLGPAELAEAARRLAAAVG